MTLLFKITISTVFLLLTSFAGTPGQMESDCGLKIKNDEMRYTIYYNSFSLFSNKQPSYLCILHLEDYNYDTVLIHCIIRNFDSFFNSKETDWAANLILLDFFEEDACVLTGDISITEWRQYYKEDCIIRWKKILKEKTAGL